ncbi:galactose mutarotase [Ideonella azotifigens]|uniref:Aldose 1-epimerase n=1 Tax=Ideonella azotifigens TaxID=513160 RepID=A0ABN1KEC6_9BURK|nr:aldose epimerase family protein [Ideonella azotifigens]MCD2340754.1 galactose mutarotase [Ideonella azotifigens]
MTTIHSRPYGTLPDGSIVDEYTLDNGRGLVLRAITYGGIVTSLQVPDRAGRSANVVLGFDALDDYVLRNPHFGVIVGRYANRIAGGRFTLDGETHQLPINDGPNCLHGGPRGFGTRLWQAEIEGDTLHLRYRSEHGEEGFPGTLDLSVRYRLDDAQGWRVDYEARCDRPTVVNLSHHDYFNLAGAGSAVGHRLQLNASRYTEVDTALIPSRIADVAGTPFDFRSSQVVEARLREGHEQLRLARGYDHNWLLDAPQDGQLHLAARLEDPASGRVMTVHTTEPAVQFYSGNFLDGTLRGQGGQLYRQGDGLCLETQHNPDSPNHPASADWPSTVLRPGEVFRSSTEHRFSTLPG